jgi:hypothetical protein
MSLRVDFEIILGIITQLNDQTASAPARKSLAAMTNSLALSMDELSNADLTALDDDYLSEVFAHV